MLHIAPLSATRSLWLDKSGVNQPVNPLAELEELKQLQQGSGNAAKERPVTSSLKWPHESGHQAVGGVDLSSARHHLTPVAVYLDWSLVDTNRCRHLFALLLFGSWSSLSLSLPVSHELARSLPPLQHVSLLDILHLTINNMIILVCVFLAITRSLSLCLFQSACLSLSLVLFSTGSLLFAVSLLCIYLWVH